MSVDLSNKLESPTLKAMEKHWTQSTWLRGLGASSIGGECTREIWLQWRYARLPEFPPRILRLFQRGHNEEPTMIAELKTAGVKVYGEQESIIGYKKHFKAHPDGRAMGILEAPKTEHLLEFKTMSDKKFSEMLGQGVKQAQPKHYAQMQIQMHLTGMTRAFYLVVNKNDDHLYAERVKYDKAEGERLQERIEYLVDATAPPEKKQCWTCRFCDMRGLCFPDKYDVGKEPELNCRTCTFSTPVDGGEWTCSQYNGEVIPNECQLKGCPRHLLIPGILAPEAVDSDGYTYVLYANGLLNFNNQYETNDVKECPDNYDHTLSHGIPF